MEFRSLYSVLANINVPGLYIQFAKNTRAQKPGEGLLLLFAIMLATLPFLGRNQNLRILECLSHEPHISGISCPTGIILGDLELYYVGLHEYVYILRNKDIFLR